ncbi:RICIN domain-containing protein [Nocardia sp. NBC_01499]|uniref:RICIN domain-containing protein n=1 Tax=Nocardia sp. NBC_01499 TaxID=2903597 RepID=UPI00386B7BE8
MATTALTVLGVVAESATAEDSDPFLLANKFSGQCLAVHQNDAPAIQDDCHPESRDQYWRYRRLGDGTSQIVNTFTGKCLAVHSSKDNNAPVIQADCHPELADQHWYVDDSGTITNGHSGKCLAVHHQDAPVFQYTCFPAFGDQYWYILP